MGLVAKYFAWLQKDVPKEDVEKYPQIDGNGESSVKGIYIIGDLTGIPLLKLAAESGKVIIDRFQQDDSFQKQIQSKNDSAIFDFVIVGAGIAGIAAGLEAIKHNYKFAILESTQRFSTIINFPKGKPIYAEPDDYEQKSELKIEDGTKESLLEDLDKQLEGKDLPIRENVKVEKIEKKGNHFELTTNQENIETLRVILAIGKSGNARMLNVPGEDKNKVFNRLFDPADTTGQKVLVVGGGDSALETAIATAEFAESVTLSYRRANFNRPKEGNENKLKRLVDQGKIQLLLETDVKEIKDGKVILQSKTGEEFEIENDVVFTMIGRELPVQFFKRSGIKLEGELTFTQKLQFALLILVSGIIYFGKSSADFYKHFFGQVDSWSSLFSNLFTGEFWWKFFTLPGEIFSTLFFSDVIRIWNVTKYINAFVAYFSFICVIALGVYLLVKFVRDYFELFAFNWKTFKYVYFILIGAFFTVVLFGERYFGLSLFGKSESFFYTGLYSLTITIFGIRRIYVKPTKYIRYQTLSLMLIQVLPLFVLPEFVFPALGEAGLLGAKEGFIMTQVFPNESYWRSYGFILAWPLNFNNLFGSSITQFWLWFSIFQTFVFIPLIVYYWGKGAYCGWICSCGAMAETLGDEYRTLMPHGAKAKRWENFGQWALLAAFLITGLKLLSHTLNFNVPIINEDISYMSSFFHKLYYIGIDVIFAGVLGVGVYFFLSGRVWCRFGCPLAALMHIYSRFSRYRIFSDKKKCISCNICTKVCHMGIDVMNYANKGIPMNDVECVRCSVCVVNCPTEVLSFGSLPKADTKNEFYKGNEIPSYKEGDWRRGIK